MDLKSRELSRQIGALTVTAGGLLGGVETAAAIGAFSGPVGAAVGAALGLGSGILGGAVIANHCEIQLEQAGAKLYKCERELNACGNVVERCMMALKKSQEELKQLKQVISNLGFSERRNKEG